MKTIFQVSGKVFWFDNDSASVDVCVSGDCAADAISKFNKHCKQTFDTEAKKKEGFVFKHASACEVKPIIQYVEV